MSGQRVEGDMVNMENVALYVPRSSVKCGAPASNVPRWGILPAGAGATAVPAKAAVDKAPSAEPSRGRRGGRTRALKDAFCIGYGGPPEGDAGLTLPVTVSVDRGGAAANMSFAAVVTVAVDGAPAVPATVATTTGAVRTGEGRSVGGEREAQRPCACGSEPRLCHCYGAICGRSGRRGRERRTWTGCQSHDRSDQHDHMDRSRHCSCHR